MEVLLYLRLIFYTKYSGGGIRIDKNKAAEKSNIYISSCLVSGNTAVVGGGLAQKHGLKSVE